MKKLLALFLLLMLSFPALAEEKDNRYDDLGLYGENGMMPVMRGGLWGIVGMIVAVPLFAVIYDLIRKLTYYVLHERGISKEEQEIIIHNKVEKEKN